MISQEQILDFIKSQSLSVLSTSTIDGHPESAVMAYSIKDNFIFIMSTEPDTRKFQNLQVNQYVSLVVGGLSDDPTCQIEGRAVVLGGDEANRAKELALAQHPDLANYMTPTIKFFIVKPHEIRYSDFSQDPPALVTLNIDSF